MNVLDGKITYAAVAEAHGLEYTPARRRPAARAGLALEGPLGFFWRGVSLTTSHVMPGGKSRRLTRT